jgi:VCBS repeat-containing protein
VRPKNRMMVRPLVSVLTTLLVLAVSPAALAAQRYAAPNGSTASQCPAGDPCTIQRAVNDAAPGDEVIVTSGNYQVDSPLNPKGALNLHGDSNHAWPRIVASGKLGGTTLTFKGGTLAHVAIEAVNPDRQALELQSGVADGIHVQSNAGTAATVTVTAAGTVLRNSIVKSLDPKSDAEALLVKDGKGASAVLRNVTVIEGASGTAIRCDVKDGTVSIVNAIARGKDMDIDAGVGCSAAYSNFRPAFSAGVAPGTANQSAEPLFADGAYRPAAGSPTIDAGALDAFASSPDPDGRPRTLGSAPDIGAYEYVPGATGGNGPADQLPDVLKGVPLPKQGRSMLVAVTTGTVRVRRPGADRYRALDEPGRIPLGSLVDARRGHVQLVTAIDGGRVQAGTFWGSKFATSQRRDGHGMTTLTLRGGNFSASACRTPQAHGAIAFTSRKRKKPRRGLWARDNGGRFRTHGNDSVATARGTAWFTEDRCSGTYTRVREGAVSVRDLVRHKRVLVKAGHSYLARKHR